VKTTGLFLLTIGCASLMCGITYAGPTNKVSLQTVSESNGKAVRERPHNGEHETQVHGGNDQTGGGRLNEKRDDSNTTDKSDQNTYTGTTRAISRLRLGGSRPKQAPSHHAHSGKEQSADSRRRSTPGNVLDFRQLGLGKSTAVPDRMVNKRTLTVQPPERSAIGGQQFKYGRNSGSSLAIIGGSANATRNTASINGTGMNRKHTN